LQCGRHATRAAPERQSRRHREENMKRFRVELIQTVFEEASVIIEAPDKATAESLAFEKAEAGKLDWSFLEKKMDSTEICECEEITDLAADMRAKLDAAGVRKGGDR
jgi:hypothetical protein